MNKKLLIAGIICVVGSILFGVIMFILNIFSSIIGSGGLLLCCIGTLGAPISGVVFIVGVVLIILGLVLKGKDEQPKSQNVPVGSPPPPPPPGN